MPTKSLRISGTVFSGNGEGARFVRLPWVKKQITEKFGFTPYPGTLNIQLTEQSDALQKSLEEAQPIDISPAEGFCRGRCFRATFMDNLKCVVVIPEIENYPKGILEVIASESLRGKFKLRDGDAVEVAIKIS